MTDYLETTVDKFIFRVATDRLYSAEGVWALAEGDRIRVGLTDFLQQRNGDVAFAEVKSEGTAVAAGDEVAVIETIKANVEVTLARRWHGCRGESGDGDCPPEAINQDPYGEGWLAVIDAPDWPADRDGAARPAGVLRADDRPRPKRKRRSYERPKSARSWSCRAAASARRTARSAARPPTRSPKTRDRSRRSSWRCRCWSWVTRTPAPRSRAHPAVTIDGCKLACAAKMVQESGGHGRPGHRSARRVPAAPGAQAAGHRRAERGRQPARPCARRGDRRRRRRRDLAARRAADHA